MRTFRRLRLKLKLKLKFKFNNNFLFLIWKKHVIILVSKRLF